MSTWSYIVSDTELPLKYEDTEVGGIEIKADDHFLSIILWPYTNGDEPAFFDLTVTCNQYGHILKVLDVICPEALLRSEPGGGPTFTRTSYSAKLPAWTSLRSLVEYLVVLGRTR